jgi:hypothetical protein
MSRTRILIPLMALTLTLTGCTRAPTAGGVAPAASAASATTAGSAAAQQVLENGTVIDDTLLGLATNCGGPDCDTRVKLATAEAIKRHGHTPVGAAQFYMPYIPPGATLGSAGGLIVVFDLDDGSQAAVHTFCFDTCFVVNPQPGPPLTLPSPDDHGPLVDPSVKAPLDCSSPDHPTCNEAVQVAIAAATTNGFIAPATITATHYYIVYVTPGSPEATTFKVEYLINLYVAGDHDNLAESVIGVYCGSGPCHAVALPK